MIQFISWLSMGGYSSYVWSAYALVSLVLVLNVLGLKWTKVQTMKTLKQWYKRQDL